MSKIRIACLTPCVGVGGGDMVMLQLIRHSQIAEWTGICVSIEPDFPDRRIKTAQVRRAVELMGRDVPIYQSRKVLDGEVQPALCSHPAVTFCDSEQDAIRSAIEGADLIFSWHFPSWPDLIHEINVPVVECIQNESVWARDIVARTSVFTDYLVAVSGAVRNILPKHRQEFCSVIYNCVDPYRAFSQRPRAQLRQEMGIPDTERILLFHGRLSPEKNAGAIIQALQHLHDCRAIISGEQQQNEKLNLINDAAKFAPGRVMFNRDPWCHPGNLYAIADAFVLVSDFEGDSVGVHEAHLAGCPVVQSNVGSAAELREQFGELSVYVPKRPSAVIVAEACDHAIGSKTRAPGVEQLGHPQFVTMENFTTSQIVHQWDRYFQVVMNDWRKKKLNLSFDTANTDYSVPSGND